MKVHKLTKLSIESLRNFRKSSEYESKNPHYNFSKATGEINQVFKRDFIVQGSEGVLDYPQGHRSVHWEPQELLYKLWAWL